MVHDIQRCIATYELVRPSLHRTAPCWCSMLGLSMASERRRRVESLEPPESQGCRRACSILYCTV
eukprot:7963785-Heterocapsa_arctica.AAC.1